MGDKPTAQKPQASTKIHPVLIAVFEDLKLALSGDKPDILKLNKICREVVLLFEGLKNKDAFRFSDLVNVVLEYPLDRQGMFVRTMVMAMKSPDLGAHIYTEILNIPPDDKSRVLMVQFSGQACADVIRKQGGVAAYNGFIESNNNKTLESLGLELIRNWYIIDPEGLSTHLRDSTTTRFNEVAIFEMCKLLSRGGDLVAAKEWLRSLHVSDQVKSELMSSLEKK